MAIWPANLLDALVKGCTSHRFHRFPVRKNRLWAQSNGYVNTRVNTHACPHRLRVVGSQGAFSSHDTVVRIAKKETSDGNYPGYLALTVSLAAQGSPEAVILEQKVKEKDKGTHSVRQEELISH